MRTNPHGQPFGSTAHAVNAALKTPRGHEAALGGRLSHAALLDGAVAVDTTRCIGVNRQTEQRCMNGVVTGREHCLGHMRVAERQQKGS